MALDVTIGGASADSYGALAGYQAYGADLGWTLSGGDATDEQNLRRAAQHIDRTYSFIGTRQYRAQAMAWPRLVEDLVNDWPIDPDTIPQDVINAQFELAYLMQGGLDPTETITGSVRSTQSKAGPVEVRTEYAGSLAAPRIVAIEGLLGPYSMSGGAGRVRVLRA